MERLKLPDEGLFPILEHAIETSQSHDTLLYASELITKQFEPKYDLLKKAIINRYYNVRYWDDLRKYEIVHAMYRTLEENNSEEAKHIMDYIDNLYVEKFKVEKEEAKTLRHFLLHDAIVRKIPNRCDDEFYLGYKSENNHVVELYFRYIEIKNARLITRFKQLKTLRIDGYHTIKNLYENLNDFPNLEILKIKDNTIQDMDRVRNVHNLKNLREFSLESSNICEIKNLDGMEKLETLELIGYTPKFKGHIGISKITGIETLVNLKHLTIKCHKIEKIEGLDNLVKLETLDLSFNNIKKMENIDMLKNLHTLNLKENLISEFTNEHKIKKIII